MRKITFLLNCNLEEKLRQHTGRKGDLSRILNEAVALWLEMDKVPDGFLCPSCGHVIFSFVPIKSAEGEKKE